VLRIGRLPPLWYEVRDICTSKQAHKFIVKNNAAQYYKSNMTTVAYIRMGEKFVNKGEDPSS